MRFRLESRRKMRVKHTEINATVGSLMRIARMRRGVTLRDLGGEIGVTESQVCNLEAGRRRIKASDLILVAKALRVPVSTLIP